MVTSNMTIKPVAFYFIHVNIYDAAVSLYCCFIVMLVHISILSVTFSECICSRQRYLYCIFYLL